MHAALRCKFRVSSVKHTAGQDGERTNEEFEAMAVYAETGENKVWSKATPSGNLKLYITNPEAFDRLRVGTEFYLDLIPVPKEEPAATAS